MAGLAGLSFRFTTVNDLDAIKSIETGLNPELDYIVESYYTFIQDPLFYGALAEINGEPVAFGVATVQMGGTKLYSRSGRTKEAWRNRGIFGMLKKFVRETLRNTVYPQLKYEEFTTHDTQPAIQKLVNSPHYKEVYRKPFLTFELGTTALPEPNPGHDVRDIGIGGIRRMLENNVMRETFFPVRLFVGYVDFEPIVSELELAASYDPFILASCSPDEENSSQLTVGVKVGSNSFVIQWTVPPNTKPSSVKEGFKEHLKLQFRRMVSLNIGGPCVIAFPPEHRDTVEITAKGFGCSVVKAMAAEFIGYRREF